MEGHSGWQPSQLVLTVTPRGLKTKNTKETTTTTKIPNNSLIDFKITLRWDTCLYFLFPFTQFTLLHPQRSNFYPFHFIKTALAKLTSVACLHVVYFNWHFFSPHLTSQSDWPTLLQETLSSFLTPQWYCLSWLCSYPFSHSFSLFLKPSYLQCISQKPWCQTYWSTLMNYLFCWNLHSSIPKVIIYFLDSPPFHFLLFSENPL